jgi:hypothetical protein
LKIHGRPVTPAVSGFPLFLTTDAFVIFSVQDGEKPRGSAYELTFTRENTELFSFLLPYDQKVDQPHVPEALSIQPRVRVGVGVGVGVRVRALLPNRVASHPPGQLSFLPGGPDYYL